MEKDLKVYVTPESEVLEVEQEGFLCASQGGEIVGPIWGAPAN